VVHDREGQQLVRATIQLLLLGERFKSSRREAWFQSLLPCFTLHVSSPLELLHLLTGRPQVSRQVRKHKRNISLKNNSHNLQACQ